MTIQGIDQNSQGYVFISVCVSAIVLVALSIICIARKNVKAKPIKVVTDDYESFRVDDVTRIGARVLGLRHVSSPEHMEKELKEGIKLGCSLNLSMRKSEHEWEKCPFMCMDAKILNMKSAEQAEILNKYQYAIDRFIAQSLAMDGKDIDKTRFMVVDYGYWKSPTDIDGRFNGLGRIPKSSVDPDRLSPLTPHPNDLNSAELVPYYRTELLKVLRSFKQFKKTSYFVF